MKVTNAMQPNADQIREWLDGKDDTPIVMVNLLKFKEKADYPDGRDADLSGREAYMRYGQAMGQLVAENGGRMIFSGRTNMTLIGEVEEDWDVVALVEYKSRKSMQQITQSPDYAAIEEHRNAGLAGQINIEVKEGGF